MSFPTANRKNKFIHDVKNLPKEDKRPQKHKLTGDSFAEYPTETESSNAVLLKAALEEAVA